VAASNVAPGGKLLAEYVSTESSWSVALTVTQFTKPRTAVCGLMAFRTGGIGFWTVTFTDEEVTTAPQVL
jgi:hypothetical protein